MNARASAPTEAKISLREVTAALIIFGLGVPLVFAFARAMSDSETRRREGPLRAMLGDESYDALARGERTETNYFGDGLLAPDFTLMDQHGKPWKLSEHRNKMVVLNFWSVTCQPCVEEMPSVVTLADIASRRDDIEVVAVSADKDWETVAPIFPPQSKLRVLFDPDRKIIKGKFGTKLFPETWVIDKRGVVRLRVDGAREWSSALSIEAIDSFL